MFYTNTTVQLPIKLRQKHQGNQIYIYEILYRKSSTNLKEKTVCVGKLCDNNHMYPNDNYYMLHGESNSNKEAKSDNDFETFVHTGANAVLHQIENDTGIRQVLEDVFGSYADLIESLVDMRVIKNDRRAYMYKYYARDHLRNNNYIPSNSMLSELMNYIITEESVKNFLHKYLTYSLSLENSVKVDIDFDSTNYATSSSTIKQAEYGAAKFSEDLPQINVAYFVNRNTGLPIYFDIYPGSVVDMSHCVHAYERIAQELDSVDACYIMDAGYFTSNIIEYMQNNHFSYCIMGRNNNTLFRNLIKRYPHEVIEKYENKVIGNIYGIKQKMKIFGKKSLNEEYVYLYYNSVSSAINRSRYEEEITKVLHMINGKEDKNGGIRKTYGKKIKIEINKNNIIVNVKPNYSYIMDTQSQMGYFYIVSSDNITLNEMLLRYKKRDQIEKCFMDSKSLSDCLKTYARTDVSFESNILFSFIAAVYIRTIVEKCAPFFIQYTSESSQTIIAELEQIRAVKNGSNYQLRQPITSKQKQILSYFGMNIPSLISYVREFDEIVKLSSLNK